MMPDETKPFWEVPFEEYVEGVLRPDRFEVEADDVKVLTTDAQKKRAIEAYRKQQERARGKS